MKQRKRVWEPCPHLWTVIARWFDTGNLPWKETRCTKCGQIRRSR